MTDATAHRERYLPEGAPIGSHFEPHTRRYAPLFYIDSFSLLRKHSAPLSADTQKAHPRMRVKMKPISLGRHRLTAQLGGTFSALGAAFGVRAGLSSIAGDRRFELFSGFAVDAGQFRVTAVIILFTGVAIGALGSAFAVSRFLDV